MAEKTLKGLKLFYRGKARDVYELGEDLLIVTTDRISCFDFVLPTPIPDKGKILTKMSLFWFDRMKDILDDHLISSDVSGIKEYIPDGEEEYFTGRIMIVKKAKRIDIECVVRGYLSGSGWAGYKDNGSICGVKLPAGLKESDKLPEPVFTPAAKADSGHDENITEEQMLKLTGADDGKYIKEKSLQLYNKAAEYALKKGIIIADTKFEFGRLPDGSRILIDEVLTPDSSRFWDMEKYEPGRAQDSFDKQFVRDYLVSIKWNKQPPVPELPEEIVSRTRDKYREALRRLTS